MSPVGANFWAGLPLGRGVEVLVHDRNGLAALAKPEGVLSHPNKPDDQSRSLLDAAYRSEGEYFELAVPTEGARGSPGSSRLWLLNRLDAATSGVILVAADETLSAAIRAQFLRKRVRKVYVALVFGLPTVLSQVWRDRLEVAKRGGVIRTTAGGGIPAESVMKVARKGRPGSGLCLLRLEPGTGRSHQLRVQCARRGFPIIGDQTYGDFARNREFAKRTGSTRLFLHSLETAFDYEFKGRKHAFRAVAPAPREFAEFL